MSETSLIHLRECLRHRHGRARLRRHHREIGEHVKQFARIAVELRQFLEREFGEFELGQFRAVDAQPHHHLFMD